MVFLWFSYGFLVFLWFSYGFPMVFLWFSYSRLHDKTNRVPVSLTSRVLLTNQTREERHGTVSLWLELRQLWVWGIGSRWTTRALKSVRNHGKSTNLMIYKHIILSMNIYILHNIIYIYIYYIYLYTHICIYTVYTHIYIHICFTVSYQNSMLTFRPYVWTNPVVNIVYDWIMRTCTLEAWFFVLPNRLGFF